MTARFGFLPLASVLVPADQRSSITGVYEDALIELGGELWTVADITESAPMFYLVGTGGTEGLILSVRETRSITAPGEPVFLIAHPGNNSLPAALEVLARLHQDGIAGRVFYLADPGDTGGLAQITAAIDDVRVLNALRSTRIGLIGPPSDWLVASMPTASAVREMWGPEVVEIPMIELVSRIEAVSDAAIEPGVRSLVSGATECVEPTGAELDSVARVHAGLRELITHHALDAVTVRCFDLVLDRSTTGCFALSALADEDIMAGCEGDLVSTVGLIWTHLLTGETPWMANPAQLDEESNTLVLAHCTVPRGLVERYRLRSHFESGLGVGIQGVLPEGDVTLVRIGGAGMEQLWVAEGVITRSGDAENLCRTQAHVQLTDGHVSDLLLAPLGNHIVLIRGHHADRLWSWWESML
ncbi:MAG: fucose isomerase [Coriobacteriia bacterium]